MIIINKKTNQLGFYLDGVLQKVFPVATGRQRSFTPEGQFRVINKMVNPPYYKKNIPGGSPYNPLGPRWLGLSAPGGPFGIHGNSNPRSIGTYASNGCIRLHNKDILWLYEQVPIGTPVIIVWSDRDLNSGFIDNQPIKVYLNNEAIPVGSEYKTFSKQGKPYIPLKFLVQLFGYTLNWYSQTNTIEISHAGFITSLTPDCKIATLNGQPVTLTDPPLVFQGTTYFTRSTIAEVFQIDVKWQPDNRDLYFSFRSPPGITGQQPEVQAEKIKNQNSLQDSNPPLTTNK